MPPNLFDSVQQPLVQGPGSDLDYDVSPGEAAATGWERGIDMNPLAYVGRQARYLSEDLGAIAGTTEWVAPDKAAEEVKARKLDLKIPEGGISRVELDMLQYLRQREINAEAVASRPQSLAARGAGLAGGFAAGAIDPINVASAFIPIVGEARYAAWLARAGESWLARAGVRAYAGAIEGAVGAALVEPIVYAGAQAEQTRYGVADSFVNVMFGGVLGGGLHVPAGAVYDWRIGRALSSLDAGLRAVEFREAAAKAPDEVHLAALQQATTALETDGPVRAGTVIADAMPRRGARDEPRGPVDTTTKAVEIAETALTDARTRLATLEQVRASDLDATEASRSATDAAIADLRKEIPQHEAAVAEARATASAAAEQTRIEQVPTQVILAAREYPNGRAPVSAFAAAEREMLDAAGFRPDAEGYLNLAPLLAEGDRRAAAGEIPHGLRYDNSHIAAWEAKKAESGAPRGLADLIPQAAAERTRDAFDRQFVEEPGDRWAQEEAVNSEAAARQVASAKEPVAADFEAETAMATAHLDSMRARGLLTESEEALIRAGNEEADRLEAEATAYEAAGACDMEDAT